MSTPGWSDQEDIVLFRMMVSAVLSSRSDYYKNPELAAWAGHGGDKINKKAQQLLRKFEATIPGAGGVVNQEYAAGSKPKKSTTKTKRPVELKHENGPLMVTTPSSSPSPKKKQKKAVVKDEEGSD